jgi:hypothetical protein
MPILGIMASQISGHLWAPEGAYDSLATVTLSASTASIEFAGIPATYKHLQVRVIARSAGTSLAGLYMSINSSVDPVIITHTILVGDGSTVTAAATEISNMVGR